MNQAVRSSDIPTFAGLFVMGDLGIGTLIPAATLHVLNDDDNANVTIFNLEGKRPTPANNDTMYIYYRMNNSTPASYEYARTTITAEDITAGGEEGSILFEVSRNGSLETVLKMSATEIVLNESGADRDFRIESDTLNAIVMDGATGNVTFGAAVIVTGDIAPGTLTMTNAVNEISTDGTLAGDSDDALLTEKAVKTYVDAAVETIRTEVKHLRFTIIDPSSVQSNDNEVCIWPVTDGAITITKITVTLDAVTNEIAGDLKWADAFIGLANATVINDFDTTSGVRVDSSIAAGAVASGKCIYISFDAQPNAAITQAVFDVEYTYD
jgi:hypothetical protein